MKSGVVNTWPRITQVENTQRFLNESIEQSHNGGATNFPMGDMVKFSLNLVNAALPTLIAPEIVMTHPMSSMSGYVSYIKFCAGNSKGETAKGDVFNDAFRLGKVDERYTSDRVVETVEASATEFKPAWTPVVGNKVVFIKEDGSEEEEDLDAEGKVTIAAGEYKKVKYVYNNVVIPQNDLPLLVAEMDAIPLVAKARRIAIYYSQMAAFQAKTDYGMDLGAQLSEKAVGQLAYEIDTEVVRLLADTAKANTETNGEWSRTLPVGVSKAEHFEGFSEIIEMGKAIIYNKTQRLKVTNNYKTQNTYCINN